MNGVTAASLLSCWERYRRSGTLARANALLELFGSDWSDNHRAAVAIGDRDRLLMQVRRALFGDRLEAVVRCPQCQTELEATFSVKSLLSIPVVTATEVAVDINGRMLHVRPISHGVLREAIASDDAEGLLLSRIVTDDGGMAIASVDDLRTGQNRSLIDAALDAVDPMGNIAIDLGCQACGHTWSEILDIVAFLWYDIDGWARSTLQMVHVLASAYGWTEETILSLPEQRRRWYYDRIRS